MRLNIAVEDIIKNIGFIKIELLWMQKVILAHIEELESLKKVKNHEIHRYKIQRFYTMYERFKAAYEDIIENEKTTKKLSIKARELNNFPIAMETNL